MIEEFRDRDLLRESRVPPRITRYQVDNGAPRALISHLNINCQAVPTDKMTVKIS